MDRYIIGSEFADMDKHEVGDEKKGEQKDCKFRKSLPQTARLREAGQRICIFLHISKT